VKDQHPEEARVAEVAPTTPEPEWVAARRRRLLGSLDLTRTRGIEIGPLSTPLARRPLAADVRYVDYLDQSGLRAKYNGDSNVVIADIVPVDAVWGERSLAELFATELPFDYVVASHVIEHVPDMVGWLHQMSAVLSPLGRVYLAVPDRRYTFDYYRRTSSLAEFIGAYLGASRHPTTAQVFDQGAYFSNLDAPKNWKAAPDPAAHLSVANLRQALEVAKAAASKPYLDIHCWVFTPRSALEVLLALFDLGLLPYRCSEFQNTPPDNNDFLIVLQKMDSSDQVAIKSARDSFASRLEALGNETNGESPTDEPSLAFALAQQQLRPSVFHATPSAPPWRSAVTSASGGRSVARRILHLSRSTLRLDPPKPCFPARVVRSPQPLPERHTLGHSFPAHTPIYEHVGDFIDADHRAISKLPATGGLIQIATPGFLRPADALALYEAAFFSRGETLELVSQSALSTVFLCQAAVNARRGGIVHTIDESPAHVPARRTTLKQLGIAGNHRHEAGAPLEAMRRLAAGRRQFGMVFLDFAQAFEPVNAVCQLLPEILLPGSVVLVHDLNDERNARSPDEYGIYDAVSRLLDSGAIECLGLVGCCGVLRKPE
jgi:SAM-dependent methyltransferase